MEPKGSLRDRLSGLVEQKTSALRDSLKARVASWKGNAAQASVAGAVAGTEEVPDVITLQIGQKSFPGVGVELRTELWLSALHRRDGAGGMVGARMVDSFPELSTQELPQEVVSDIDKDLKRTFPQYALYNTAEGQQQLRTILHAYAAYDPEVGYCQGMNFLAGILMLFLNTEAEAFAALVLLMQERKLRTFYIRSMALLQVQLWQLGKLMSPKLCTHLESCGVVPMLYGAPWLMTGFSADFPVSFSARIMDVMLSDRCHCALLKVAVSILKRCEAVLHQMSDLEAILKYLKVEVPKWSEYELSDVLVDAFAKPWTTRQKTILSNTEDVETVAQGMERVMDLQEQLSRGPGQPEEDEEEDSSTGAGNGAGLVRCENSDTSARGAASRTAQFSETGGYCVRILAPPPSTSTQLCHLSASNPPSNASSNPTSPAVAFGARGLDRSLDRSVDAASTLYSVPEGHPTSCAPPAKQLQMGSMPLPACSSTLAPDPQLTARQMRLPAQTLSKSLPCALLSSSELQDPNALMQQQQQQQQVALGALYTSSGEAAGLAGDEARGDAMHDGGCEGRTSSEALQQDSQREHLCSPIGTPPKGGYYPPLGSQSPFARSVGTAHAVLAAAAAPVLVIPEPIDGSQRPSAAASAYASPRGACPAGEGWDGPAPAPPAAAAGWAASASPAGGSSRSGSASLPIVIQSHRSYGPSAGSVGGLGDGELLSPRSPHPPAPGPAADRPSDNAPYHEPDGFDELASSGSYSTKLLQELRRNLSLNLNLNSGSNSNSNGAAANLSGYRGLSTLDTSCLGSPNSMLSLTTAQSPGSTYPCPTPVPPAYTSAGCTRQDLSVAGDAPGPRQCQGSEVEVGRLSGASSCASAARPYAPAAAAAAAAAALLPPLDAPVLLVRSSSNRGSAQTAREECHRLFESLPRSRGSGPLPKVCDEAGDLAGDILRAFVACGTARKGAMYDPQERLAEAMYADSPQKEEHKFFGDAESPSPCCVQQSPEGQQEQAGAAAAAGAGLPEAQILMAPPAALCSQPVPPPPVLTRQPSASMGSVGGVAIFDPKHMCGHESSVRLSAGGAPAASVPGPVPASRRASADVWMKSGADGYGNTVPGASSQSVTLPAGSGVDGMWGVGASNWGAAASSCHSPHTPLVARMELLHGTSMLELAHAAVAMQAAMDAAQQQAQEEEEAAKPQQVEVNVPDTILPSGDGGLASLTVDADGHRPLGGVGLEASSGSPSSSESPEPLPAPWRSQGDGCMSVEEQERSAALHSVVTAVLPDVCPAVLQAALHASWVSGLGGGGGGGSGPGSPHTPLVAKMELPRGTSMLALARATAAVQAALEAAAQGLPHIRNPARMVLEPRDSKCPPPSGLESHAGTERTSSFISARASLDLDTPAGVLQLDQAEHGNL